MCRFHGGRVLDVRDVPVVLHPDNEMTHATHQDARTHVVEANLDNVQFEANLRFKEENVLQVKIVKVKLVDH